MVQKELFWPTCPIEPTLAVDTRLIGTWSRSTSAPFQAYAERRRKQRDAGARRILADFVIGAHASANGCRLLTLDDRLYRSSFPTLAIETF